PLSPCRLPGLAASLFVFCSGYPRDLPSFPTRRSSDLRFTSVPGIAAAVPMATAQVPIIAWCSLPIDSARTLRSMSAAAMALPLRSEEHTSELQSRENLVCRLLLEKKKQPHVDGTMRTP